MLKREKSAALYEKAKQFFPGGVNSPVRAFKSVGGTPLFIEGAKGSRIRDVDGNEFIDYCCSWGPLILGHNHREVRTWLIKTALKGTTFGAPHIMENWLADIILSNNKYIEKIRFVSSGTEAVMSALRLARGCTNRDKIIKFDGCYHGHSDSMLVKAGSGLATFGIASSAGVPASFINETIVLPLNDMEAVSKAFSSFKNQIAAIIIEPIPANNGLLLQDKEYLQFLRDICTENGSMLIFDEVISGFRIGFEGAAGYYKIQPDIITYGKIIGGGMPVGAYGASAEIMSRISPDGDVYQAGTLSGNPVAMAAGMAQLLECLKPGFYEELEKKTWRFMRAMHRYAEKKKYPVKVFCIGSIFWVAFTTEEKIQSADKIDPKSMELFKVLHEALLERGVYLGPSGYEVGFFSAAHTDDDLELTFEAFRGALDVVFAK